MTITASGTLKQTIQKGAQVDINVRYGLITLIKQTVDLCDQVQNVDLECPIEKGKLSLIKEVELPKEIPPVRIPPERRRARPSRPQYLPMVIGKIHR